jgi:tetratricopeptide (TPR) repeat protein
MLREIRQNLNSQPNPDEDLDLDNNVEQNLKKSSSNVSSSNLNSSLQLNSSPLRQLNDNDHEFLFDQLLEGVAHGWHEGKIVKFFERLETRGKSELWIEWLERFGTKILAKSVPDRELAARMLLFGQTVQSSPSLKNFGLLAYQIGHKLIGNNDGDSVWEYSEIEIVNDVPPTPADWQNLTSREETIWEYEEIPSPNFSTQDNIPPEINNSSAEVSQISSDIAPSSSSLEFVESPQQPDLDFVARTSTTPALVNDDLDRDVGDLDLSSVVEEISLSPNLAAAETIASSETNTEIVSHDSSINGSTPEILDDLASSPIISASDSTNIEQNLNLSPTPPSQNLEADIPSLTPEQLLWILQQDANLIAQMSAQLNIDTTDPKLLIQTSIDRYQSEQRSDEQKNLELAESWFELGLKQVNLNNMEEAISAWDKAIAINPNLASAWHNRGSALGHLSKFTEAIASFDKALEIDPQDAQTWNDRAHALLKLKRWSEAIESWDKAIDIYPNFYQFWYNRGYALEKLGRSEESIASYEKALQMQPDVLSINNRYSKLLENMTDLDR